MRSLMDSLRTLGLAEMHGAVDHVVDMKSPEVIAQEIRDLEGSLLKLKESRSEFSGHITTLTQNLQSLNADEGKYHAQSEALVQQGKDEIAKLALTKLTETEARIKTTEAELSDTQQKQAKMDQAISQFTARINALNDQLRQLQSSAHARQAENEAAKNLERAADTLGAAGSTSVDDILAREKEEENVADARFNQAIGDFAPADPVTDALQQSEVDARLAELKAKMANAGIAPAQAPA